VSTQPAWGAVPALPLPVLRHLPAATPPATATAAAAGSGAVGTASAGSAVNATWLDAGSSACGSLAAHVGSWAREGCERALAEGWVPAWAVTLESLGTAASALLVLAVAALASPPAPPPPCRSPSPSCHLSPAQQAEPRDAWGAAGCGDVSSRSDGDDWREGRSRCLSTGRPVAPAPPSSGAEDDGARPFLPAPQFALAAEWRGVAMAAAVGALLLRCSAPPLAPFCAAAAYATSAAAANAVAVAAAAAGLGRAAAGGAVAVAGAGGAIGGVGWVLGAVADAYPIALLVLTALVVGVAASFLVQVREFVCAARSGAFGVWEVESARLRHDASPPLPPHSSHWGADLTPMCRPGVITLVGGSGAMNNACESSARWCQVWAVRSGTGKN
jgi:hypothetical protein